VNPAPETVLLPDPSSATFSASWASSLLVALRRAFLETGVRVNRLLPKDGTEPMTTPLPLASYLTANLPAAASSKGMVVFVSDATAGHHFQGSDGSSWVTLG